MKLSLIDQFNLLSFGRLMPEQYAADGYYALEYVSAKYAPLFGFDYCYTF